MQPDGKILIGGSFTAVDGVKRIGIARLYGGDNHNSPLKFATIERFPNRDIRLFLVARPFTRYVIEASANLTTWTAISTNAPKDFTFDFVDDSASDFDQRFYRARKLEP